MKRLSVLAAVVLVVLMVHAWEGSAVGVSPLESCTTNCTGLADGHQIPDPYNCTTFYVCNNNKPLGPLPCDPGNFFDPSAGACASSNSTECEPICGGGANCPLTCNGTVSEIGSAFNCSNYYYCTPGGPSAKQTCPSDYPYYDGNSFSCTRNESVCCRGYCTPYCSSSGFALIPDPKSCTMYYVCLAEGDVNQDYRLSCDAGMVFSVSFGDCVADTGEPCQTLCEAAGAGLGAPPQSPPRPLPLRAEATATVADINGCVSSLVCTAEGLFPACSTCQPEYFQCSGVGAMGVLDSCTDDYVFNSTPGYHYCVLPSNCPYP